jgi:hypothetical protein
MAHPLFPYWFLHQPFTQPQFLRIDAVEADGTFTGSLNQYAIAGNWDANANAITITYQPVVGRAGVITEYQGALVPTPAGQGLSGVATRLGVQFAWWAESLIG